MYGFNVWTHHLKPNFVKITLGVFGIFLFLVFLEFCWFWVVLKKVPGNEKTDAVVVFGGSHARTAKGYGLVNRGYAPFLIVSPASETYLERLDKTYRLKDSYRYLIEDGAETTFQNAVLVERLIQKHDLTSVLLVTSDYHMPRSAFLIKLQLLGCGVTVRLCPVEVGRFRRNPLAWSSIQKKIIYNEMIEFWGSVAEMVHYLVSRRLPKKGIKRNKALSWLRAVFLFDVSKP